MKMYHYFVSYAVSYADHYTLGMAEIRRSEKVASMDDIISFRENIAEKLYTTRPDAIFIIGYNLIQDRPY